MFLSDEEILKAFEGTNFGRTDYRELLNSSVLKKMLGYHCGHTITMIMKDLGLIGVKTERPTKMGILFLREAYDHLMRDGG